MNYTMNLTDISYNGFGGILLGGSGVLIGTWYLVLSFESEYCKCIVLSLWYIQLTVTSFISCPYGDLYCSCCDIVVVHPFFVVWMAITVKKSWNRQGLFEEEISYSQCLGFTGTEKESQGF